MDLLLTSRSLAAAWVGEHVPDFSHGGFFSWFSCPAQQIGHSNLWYYRRGPSMAWKGKRGNLKKLLFQSETWVFYSAFAENLKL